MIKKEKGTKVWVLVVNQQGLFVAIDKTPHTIVSVKPYNECHDYCNHIIIGNDNGVEKEVREYECIIMPREELSGDEQLSRFLSDNGCNNDCVYTNSEGTTSVEISWGDWKHQHLWCNDLMGYIGYEIACEEGVTEENGSDCYSSIHYFKKSE